MTFNKKLLLAGLAVGITTYILYKQSKKREKEKLKIQQSTGGPGAGGVSGYSHSSTPSSSGHNYAAWGAGAAAVGAAGYAAHHHHQQQQQQLQQPQAYAPAPTGPPPEQTGQTSWDDLRDWKVIARILAACVADQYLYPWYDWAKVQYIAQQIAQNGALADIAEAWQVPPFLAQDLVKLALFDVMFLLDDSASMRSEGHARRDGLKQILKRAADAAGRLDPDGMQVAWMNADVPPQESVIRSARDAERLCDHCRYDGRATPMGGAFEEKLLVPYLYSPLDRGYLPKPVLTIIITDGRPTGSSERGERIVSAIKNAKSRLGNTQYGEDALSVTIAAVGNDREAQDWLDSIDSHPVVGDLVDVCSDIRVEGAQVKRATGIDLSPDLHCLKLLLGAIDSEYDASDEPPSGKTSRRRREKEAKDARFAHLRQKLIADRDAAMYGGGGAQPQPQPQQQPQYGYGYPQPPQQQPQQPPTGAATPYGMPSQQPPPQQQYGAPPPPCGQPPAGAAYGQYPQGQYGQPPPGQQYPQYGGGYAQPPHSAGYAQGGYPQGGGYYPPPQGY